MSNQQNQLLDGICSSAKNICENAKKAKRHGRALKGDNFYGNKFHELVVEFTGFESELDGILAGTDLPETCITEFKRKLVVIKASDTPVAQRTDALKELQILIQSTIRPALTRPPSIPTPKGEPVLPIAVVSSTRGYIESVVVQSNACYEARCFDACSVMIRKLVEMLLLELYESKGKEAEIKNAGGDYLMLSDLINIALKDVGWNFGRETKQAFPKLKSLGDRAAHNRRFMATKADVDAVLSGLRVVTDDLLQLASLK